MTEHRCHFADCKVRTPRRLLFCREHWLQVPTTLRWQLLAAWDHGKWRQTYEGRHRYAVATMACKRALLQKHLAGG